MSSPVVEVWRTPQPQCFLTDTNREEGHMLGLEDFMTIQRPGVSTPATLRRIRRGERPVAERLTR